MFKLSFFNSTLSDQVNKQLGTQSSKLEKLENENKALSQFLSEVEAVRNRYMREIDELKRSVQNEDKDGGHIKDVFLDFPLLKNPVFNL